MPIAAWTETLLKDLRYATRQFARNPVFTLVAMASLAIGIGANTAIFSVMNVVMLKSLPVRDPQGLVMLTDPNTSGVSSGLNARRARHADLCRVRPVARPRHHPRRPVRRAGADESLAGADCRRPAGRGPRPAGVRRIFFRARRRSGDRALLQPRRSQSSGTRPVCGHQL